MHTILYGDSLAIVEKSSLVSGEKLAISIHFYKKAFIAVLLVNDSIDDTETRDDDAEMYYQHLFLKSENLQDAINEVQTKNLIVRKDWLDFYKWKLAEKIKV